MEYEEQRKIIKEAFGESSSDTDTEKEKENNNNNNNNNNNKNHSMLLFNWEQVCEKINGLWVCKDFLSTNHQSLLLSAIQSEGWFTQASHNQAMRFGDLPAWATELSDTVYEAVHMSDYSSCIFPSNLLWREPLFDQLIVNVYQPGEGICAHVDLLKFEDGIAIVSLESSCVMHFTQVESESESDICMDKVAVYLTPGSLVLLSGEARYKWKHEINRKPGFQKWLGKEIDQRRRTSITLRKLCSSESGVTESSASYLLDG